MSNIGDTIAIAKHYLLNALLVSLTQFSLNYSYSNYSADRSITDIRCGFRSINRE